jgi:hypothetical protein
MSTPSYGDVITRVGDILRYPKRVLIEVLQKGFAEEYLFTNSEGAKVINPYLYVVDENGETSEDSKIEIADTWTEELEGTDPRPMITLVRHEMPIGESSIRSLREYEMPASNTKKYSEVVSMPISANCWSRKDLESEEIAMTVAFFIRLFRDIHIARTRLDKITAPTVGSTTPVKLDAEHELFVTPVTFTTHYSLHWKLTHTNLEEAKDFNVNISMKSGE